MRELTETRRVVPVVAVLGTILAVVLLAIVVTSPAGAETPAERCKRETAAYNSAWKNAWLQANPGKSPGDAPPPPVPYTCHGDDGPPPTLDTTPPETSPPVTSSATPEPSASSTAESPATTTPAPTSSRLLEHPGPGQPTIDAGGKRTAAVRDGFKVEAADDGNDGNGGITSDSSSYPDKLSGITIYANAWACALYWKHCSFATSAKTYRDGQRFAVNMIRNIATAKTHGISASVEISGGKGNGGTVGLTAQGSDKNVKTLTWENTKSYISDVAGTADCGMFSTYFSVTSEGWFEHDGAKGYVSAGVRN
ncbi:hypothetical protein [Gordonia sp. (in: high G+C Gram-positive bacteria)]|uniref:hypothetical protein n=1 Tax=Gordonia sp. (in: high G+C Gram-positive bacteria) TaxID=84139 RepID=UPI003529C58F